MQHDKPCFRTSSHYIWNEADILGRGATALVYKAWHKTKNEECAVKVFHKRVSLQFSLLPRKEVEIVQKLNHRNIIKIFDIDTEPITGNYVIGMVYCKGGSLYSQIDQPENAFGFPEDEYLIVLKDISEGMKHLRDNQILHRDVKPGNIMRFIDDNGMSVYKFTDFGAARELDDEENFNSLYGTEEYLDPVMYGQAVLKRPNPNGFNADIDIWSLGVTLFHVATGKLPFMPYRGRSDPTTMFKITTGKKPGDISGWQKYPEGPIEYSKDLPRTCQLSSSLKTLLKPVLAGLMENERSLRWTYEKFYSEVFNILDRKIFKVFDCCSGLCMKIYSKKSDKYANIQEVIAQETEIPSADQLILYHNDELCNVVDPITDVEHYPKSIQVGQLFLYNRGSMEKQKLSVSEIPALPLLPDSLITLDRDAHFLHKLASIGYLLVKAVRSVIQQQELMHRAETHLRDYIWIIISRINNCLPDIQLHLDEHKKRQGTFFDTLGSCIYHLRSSSTCLKEEGQVFQKNIENLNALLSDKAPKDVLAKAEARYEEVKVYMSVLVEKMKEQETEAITSLVGCLEEDHCILKIEHQTSQVMEIWNAFVKHKKQKNLCSEEEFIHNCQREKAYEIVGQMLSVYEGHCKRSLSKVYDNVMKQTSLLMKNLHRTKKVDQNITCVKDCRGRLSERIDKMEKSFQKCMSETSKVFETYNFKEGSLSCLTSGYQTLSTASMNSFESLQKDVMRECDANSKQLAENKTILQTLVTDMENPS